MIDLQRTQKGFLFTLDAVFALIVASLGISILLYVHYTNNAQFIQTSLEATSVLNNLVQTTVGYAGTGSQLTSYLSGAGNAAASTWPTYAHDQALSSSAGFGPPPYLLYSTNFNSVAGSMPDSVNVDGGWVLFTTGASSNQIYAVNATTGATISGFPITTAGTSLTNPILYNNEIIVGNWLSGCSPCGIEGLSKTTGAQLWFTNMGAAATTPLELEGGYVAYGCGSTNLCIVNPVNGSGAFGIAMPSSLKAQLPAYANGEYLVSTTSVGSLNYLLSYTYTSAGSLVNTWQLPLSTSASTNPVIVGNRIAVGSGTSLYLATLSGVLVSTVSLTGQTKGIASSGGNVYVQTAAGIYGFNATGSQIFSHTTVAETENLTPSVAGSTLYTLINGYLFQGYNVQTGQQLWNITLPYTPPITSNFFNIALGYGNAYIPNNNNLYAFGTYKAKPSDNLLQSLGSMYLNNQGAYASLMLSKLYPSQNVGLYINSTYAPDLQVATFNGVSSYVTTPALITPVNHTIVLWMETNSPRTSPAQIAVSLWGAYNAHLGIYGSGEGFTFARDGGGAISSNVVPVAGQWYQVALVLNSAKIASIYVNGALKGTGTAPAQTEVWTIGDIIGSDVSPPASAFSGQIADVQFYNSTLTAGQIQQLYSQGIFGQPLGGPKLLGWWPLDGNGNDYSGNFRAGFPYNVVYQPATYLPGSLLNSYQVSKATAPLVLPSNGINNFYNVSVVIWK
ncbi:MAG TPA: LamG-like jellyroll fold domain-containing protein [Candidatus Acidoferrales bacterium]|nr:LamG-like jellyroll fold domain-containing protein [Candidatus Acidoferrales bacterium]